MLWVEPPRSDGLWFVFQSCPVTIATVFDSKASLVMGMFLGTGALLVRVGQITPPLNNDCVKDRL